ncbi:protease inhibitor I42 family protein [Methylocapsa acidiphila]|uniref:protease inhibitor I42 family protein n=1 Tax=Methylocapsa acidiphila TaxID=133552 RepID=UPI0004196851|nr:protease inhibitor I42 family protein [Methylocapsa acidiphila]
MLRSALLIVAGAACCAAQAGDRTLRLAVGERGSIALAENRTTGYSWRIDPSASANLNLLRMEDGGYAPPGADPDRPLVGAPGLHRWSVMALSGGRARIAFVYQRPWEPEPAKRENVVVEIP